MLYKKALNLNSSWEEGWWFLGTLYYDGDQYTAGRDAFQRVVDLNAGAKPAWGLLGLCEFETGDYAKSLTDIERGSSQGAGVEPQMEHVLVYHYAILLTRKGDSDKALREYASLVRGRAPNDLLFESVGLAALHAKLLPKEIPATQLDLYLSAGKTAALVLTGDYSHADASFSDLLERYPTTPNVHYMHGVYLIARDPEVALDEFKRELEIAPSNSDASLMLAWGLLTRGDSAVALRYARRAFESAPNLPLAQYVLGRALVETGDVKGGLGYLERAERTDSTNVDTHVVLAYAYSRLGRPQAARRERQIAISMTKEKGQFAQP